MWYYMQNEKQVGPVDDNELRQLAQSGAINAQTPVWKNGMADWMAAATVGELTEMFKNSPPTEPVLPQGPPSFPPPNTAGQSAGYAQNGNRTVHNDDSFFSYYGACWKKSSTLQGRSRRKEYWAWGVVNMLIYILLDLMAVALSSISQEAIFVVLIPYWIYFIASICPNICVYVRRLHDMDKNGWLVLLVFIPIVNLILLLVMGIIDGTPGPNRYGPDPKGR